MHTIDYLIVALYLIGTLLLGAWLGRGMRSGNDFFLGGRSLPWWAIGLSLVVSDIGAKDIVGLAQDAYRHGWVMANWDWIGCIPAMLLCAVLFVPYFWAGGFYTVPEYLGRRFGESVQLVTTLAWGLFIAGNIGGIFSASTAVIGAMLGVPLEYEWVILVTAAAAVGFYTYSGGLAAVVYTDVIQCALMTVGMALVLYYAYQHPAVGGWENLEAQVTASHPDHFKLFHPPENPSSFTTFSIVFGLGMVLGPGYWIGNQVIVQRVLGARSLADARTGVLFGALVKVIFPVLLVMPGILAIVILPQALSGESTRQVFPLLVRDLLPAGLRGIVFAAMLAGMMGNVDSYLNSAATLWTKDVLRKYVFKPSGADPRVEAALDLRLGRSLTVAFLAAGVAVAPFVVNIFTFMQWMLSLLQGPTFALLIFGILWRRATAAGGLAGCAVGFGASILLDRFKKPIFGYDEPLLHVAWWSFVAASLSLVAVSLATAPIPRERLRGLVYGLPAGPAGDEKESGDGARS